MSPATPASATGNSTGQHGAAAGHAALGSVASGGPVIRRSLSSAAHSLFRSLLGSSAANPAPDAVLAESSSMFDNFADEPAVIRRFRQPGSDPAEQLDSHRSDGDELSPAMRARDFDELIDRIVAKLEHRVLEDLERRGRRGIPEVF
jgi:hypothetical protein